MIAEAMDWILQRSQRPQMVEGFLTRHKDWLADDPAALVKGGPQAKSVTVSTLGALVAYLQANRDGLAVDRLIVHVVSPTVVLVGGPLDPRALTRQWYSGAAASDLTDGFLNKYWSLDDFVIALQTRFLDVDSGMARAQLLKLFGNIKASTVKVSADDGITQAVEVRTGIILGQEASVPNPVVLRPYRTFREVLQPESPFVLRLKAGARPDSLPEAALFEGDGGAWKLMAIARVRDWLTVELAAAKVDVAVLA